MRKLLNKQLLKQLELIEYIGYKTYSMDEIMNKFQYHIQTVNAYIFEINRIVAPIEIRVDDKKQISIYYPNNYSIEYIYSRFIHESIEFKLLEYVFFDESKSIEKCANKLYLTSSTLRRIINRMNIELEKMSFSIEGKKLAIVGDEGKIGHYMVRLFLEKYIDKEVPFDSKQLKGVNLLLKYYAQYDTSILNFKDFEIIKNHILVSIIRTKNKHYIYDERVNIDKFNNRIVKSKTVRTIFIKLFNVELDNHLIYRLTYIVTSGEYLSSYKDFENNSKNKKEVEKKISKIEGIIYQIQKELDLPLKNKENLVFSLYNEYAMQYGKNYILYDITGEFTLSLEGLYPEAVVKLKQALMPLCLTEESWEINQYVYIFVTHCDSFIKTIRTREDKVKVALFSTYDLEYQEFLKDEIELNFSYHFEIEILKEYPIKNIDAQKPNCDIIVTNIAGLSYDGIVTLCFPVFPKMENWENLYRAYGEVLSKRNKEKMRKS